MVKSMLVTCLTCGRGFTALIQTQPYEKIVCPSCGTQESLPLPLYKFREEHRPIYRIYQTKLKGEEDREPVTFCVSSVREISFRRDIEEGHMLLVSESMELQYETFDRNAARILATEF